jgi:hypothetical protein
MRKTTLFAFTPALMAIGFGVWAASPANMPVSPSIGQGIEPFQMMVTSSCKSGHRILAEISLGKHCVTGHSRRGRRMRETGTGSQAARI